MSHKAQRIFCRQVKKLFPRHFKNVNVIDVGSKDINGNNRRLFSRSHYIGIDLSEGKNVDVVGRAHLVIPGLQRVLSPNAVWSPDTPRIEYEDKFDTIISTECLEHDKFINQTLLAMYSKLKKGGLLVITCAGDGQPEHGTAQYSPDASPDTNDYYATVSNHILSGILHPLGFKVYHLVQVEGDLQFYGIKA